MLPGLDFPNVKDFDLKRIWFESEGFNPDRGTGWMKEPGSKSPLHHWVTDAVAQAEVQTSKGDTHRPLVFRSAAESKRLAAAADFQRP
jgi:PqqA peptide cyclase